MRTVDKLYKKRSITLCIVFFMLLGFCTFRILNLQNNSEFRNVADMQFSKTVTLAKSRGYIYDRNLNPLVNEDKNLRKLLLTDDIKYKSNESLFEEITPGIVLSMDDELIMSDGFQEYYDISRYNDSSLCRHIVGYVDSSDKGVCGIEKAFDRILADASGKLKINFNSDASGKVLVGNGIKINDENYDSCAGVILTIDKEIQGIAENAIINSDIKCGAAVVIDVNTFEILALVSIPFYDQNNIENSLNDENLPFLNRALCSYPAGSVFKPFVAISALENGYKISNLYECSGHITVNNTDFTCYNTKSHGKVDLNKAIEKSCNTFFINLGINLGAEKLIKTLSAFGFGKEIKLCSTIISDKGNIPPSDFILSDAQLANLCFGQGEILVTPVQLAAAYAVLANGGTYIEPTVLKELMDDDGDIYATYRPETKYQVTDEEICQAVNSALYNNMLNGTGINASSEIVLSAGKTATAQTGRYDENGQEQLVTWFAGFFPFDDPKYAVVVMNEKGSTASIDCAPVFKNIMEKIMLT